MSLRDALGKWWGEALTFIRREWLTLGVLVALLLFVLYAAWSINHEMDGHRNYDHASCIEQKPPSPQAVPPAKHEGDPEKETAAGQDPGEGARVARVANCLAADANEIASGSLVLTGLMAIFSLFAFAFSAIAVIVAVRVDRHRIDAPIDKVGDQAGGG